MFSTTATHGTLATEEDTETSQDKKKCQIRQFIHRVAEDDTPLASKTS
jgi:hypothetical protein